MSSRPRDIALCVAAVLLMIIPAVGSVYLVPDAPVKYFPYAFLVYLVVGVIRVAAVRTHRAKAGEEIHATHISGLLAQD